MKSHGRLFWLIALVVTASLLTTSIDLTAQSVGGGATKENLDLPYDAIGEAGDEADAPEIVVFYGQNYEADGIFYVIDRSGSMQSSGELGIAKREVVRNIREFSPQVEFGIVFFDRGVLKYPTSGRPTDADSGAKASAAGWVSGMAGGGGSEITKGLMAGLDFSNKSSASRKSLIYLGDGGGRTPALLGQVKGRNTGQATIHTIGVLDVGPDARKFLQQLAQSNNGTYTEIKR